MENKKTYEKSNNLAIGITTAVAGVAAGVVALGLVGYGLGYWHGLDVGLRGNVPNIIRIEDTNWDGLPDIIIRTQNEREIIFYKMGDNHYIREDRVPSYIRANDQGSLDDRIQ